MNRTTSIALAAVLLVATLAAPLGAATVVSNGVQDGAESEPADRNDRNESIAPGEQFAGVVGVQKAELDGDVSERAYDVRIERAASDEAKAAVVDERVRESEARLADLETRLEELDDSREAGEITEGRYRAEVATVVAEIRTVERELDALEATADDLPDRALADRGVDRESIRTLRDRADELGGSETAAVARSVAGPDAGHPGDDDRHPGDPHPGDENRSAAE